MPERRFSRANRAAPGDRCCLQAFESPTTHEAISRIIRERSANPRDVREVALEGLELSATREILDLGCGFGFFAEVIAPQVSSAARLTGVDACPSNEKPFLQCVRATGRQARFVAMHVSRDLPWDDGAFDLVICAYSLYFFPGVLPEVVRVLAPDGILIALTHSERSFTGMLAAADLASPEAPLTTLIRRFSAENGAHQLGPWFGAVERIVYPNALRFTRQGQQDLLTYLRFKLPLLGKEIPPEEDLPQELQSSIAVWFRDHDEVVIEKDDACFRCREPRRRRAT